MVIIPLLRDTKVAKTEGLWLPKHEVEPNEPTTKDLMRAPGLVCTSLYNPPSFT